MVKELQIHKPLVHILGNTSDTRLSHVAAGFLKQLARPTENEETLRAAGTVKAVFWQLGSDKLPDLTHALLSLLRRLLVDSPENVKQVLVPADYPRSNEGLLSNVHTLLSIFTRSDNAAIKIEIGLIFKEICKCLVSLQKEMAIEDVVFSQLCLHADVARPADFLIRQTQPLLQSQGWFTFALMARSREGSRAVAGCIASDGLYDLLAQRIEAYHEQELAIQVQIESGVSDKTSDAVGKVDGNSVEHNDVERSNALMLVHELLRNGIPDSQLQARLQGLLDTTGASA
ncbi:hypothetical protein B0A49_13409 [Cryomyces minteri]|uniref:Uncharacterized protein n=1 Tax=Cryomyces minteri TaxID=331657 RepID=A0A4U0V9A7_9PEZI|nr:hypothetical protein B0A49_13409 [Cryomyces minteri]